MHMRQKYRPIILSDIYQYRYIRRKFSTPTYQVHFNYCLILCISKGISYLNLITMLYIIILFFQILWNYVFFMLILWFCYFLTSFFSAKPIYLNLYIYFQNYQIYFKKHSHLIHLNMIVSRTIHFLIFSFCIYLNINFKCFFNFKMFKGIET